MAEEKYKDVSFLLLQAALFSRDGISTRALMQNMSVSYATLKKRLDYINEHQYLLSQMDGKQKVYKLNLGALEEHGDFL